METVIPVAALSEPLENAAALQNTKACRMLYRTVMSNSSCWMFEPLEVRLMAVYSSVRIYQCEYDLLVVYVYVCISCNY
jgi:hypothetical protein